MKLLILGATDRTRSCTSSTRRPKAKQNDTPNAYVRGTANDPRIAPLIGRVVRYEVGPDDLELAPATPEQVAGWLEQVRPAQPQTPPRDLGVTEIVDLDTIGHDAVNSVGFRAFDDREFHRIDHLAAAMGVLVHVNFDDELANGVAVTKNPYHPDWPGFYVNVQVGESLVTSPDPNATPDELLISAIDRATSTRRSTSAARR